MARIIWDVYLPVFWETKQIKAPAKFQLYGIQPFVYLLHFVNPNKLMWY